MDFPCIHRIPSSLTRALVTPCLLLLAVSARATDDLAQLTREAVQRNPGIEALRARTRELTDLSDVSTTWQDPLFSVEYLNAPVDSFSISDSPMSGVQFTLKQRLPSWGWTDSVREVAAIRVEANRHARAEAEVQLKRSVEALYWKLTLTRLLEAVTREHVERTDELLRAVRVRYEVGRAGQNGLLRLEVLRARLEDDLGDFERAERQLSAGLARSLARSQALGFETPAEVEPIAPQGDALHWLEMALQSRPELARLRDQVKEQRTSARLSRVSIRPEIDLWVKYRVRTVETPIDDGTDFFSAGIAIPIPVGGWKRGRGHEAARIAASESARSRLAARRDEIESDLISVEASWRRSIEKVNTYQQVLIPSSRAALETTLSDYSVGKAEFSTLYEAEVELLDLERALLIASVDTHLQRARARALVGRDDLGGAS
ncbi:MAG: TolC family protein [Deltaproteobacteria bacterium]|nr:TolC family protein [Deltaproteobacteria bacterium]